ncbi:MAG: carbamoyltransferase, partial [Deltaproteobacteria bacterium]|nr:carbamoyltransferase [Deltaproteobacteria bacterium]
LHLARTRGLRPRRLDHVFFGPSATEAECRAATARLGDAFTVEQPDDMASPAAALLAEGAVVARFDGALEYGPRALGNRSILARTDDPSINDWLNERLHRSEYMPFAPVTLASEAGALYEHLDGAAHCVPFMTVALPVTSSVGQEHAAVVHVDGTARPQVLNAAGNPGLHAILSAFHRRTGMPSLVNTSFNRHGEPIVCTPADAVDTFLGAGLDALILGPLLVRRLHPLPRP